MNIVIASLILIILFGLVFRRGYQSYHIGRFLVIVLYFFIGVSFGALSVGLILQALQTEESLTQAIFFMVGIASGVLGLKFLKDMGLVWSRS